jgi:DNA-binding CsgD family transcriptional regulator
MTPGPIDSLTPRQLACLRGVADLLKPGEIATRLGMSESTVRGHLDAANRKLGTRRTADAARLLREHEAEQGPRDLPGTSSRVDPPPPPAPVVEPPTGSSPRWLPFRPRGARANLLSPLERLLWIFALAMLFAIGFGMLATGLEVLTRLIERL